MKNFSILFLILFVSFQSFAQETRALKSKVDQNKFSQTGSIVYGTFSVQWETARQVGSFNDLNKIFAAPWFHDCQSDSKVSNLTYFEFRIPVGPDEQLSIQTITPSGIIEETSELFSESVLEAKFQQRGEWYPSSHVLLGEITEEKWSYFQTVKIYPQLISTSGDRVRKASTLGYSFLKIKSPGGARPIAPLKIYSPHSVLENGDWLKVPVFSDGIYKIDYNYLNGLGIDLQNLDPRTLRLHGTGGGMLSQNTSAFRYDDLPEMAIEVSGENDGTFDQGDFILFYGKGPVNWEYYSNLGRFAHTQHIYSDSNFYFLSYGSGNGKRIPQVTNPNSPSFTATYGTQFTVHETDQQNLIKTGRVWMGETFGFDPDITIDFPVGQLAPGSDVRMIIRAGATSQILSDFTIREEGTTIAVLPIPYTPVTDHGYAYRCNDIDFTFPASQISDEAVNLELIYSKPLNSSQGYLDFIELSYKRQLNLNGQNYLPFTVIENTGPGQIGGISLSNGSSLYRIWNISDIRNVDAQNYSNVSGNLSFNFNADSISRFVAFSPAAFKTPGPARRIQNQDLHGLGRANFVIITYPAFKGAAEELAQFHRDHYDQKVHVVTTQEVYNEFSSGSQEPTAIRDFLKMLYDRGYYTKDELQYAMLLGDGSYDYKNKTSASETSFVPSYQSRKSEKDTDSYTSDDYFAFLGEGEGFWSEGAAIVGGYNDILFGLEGDSSSVSNHSLDIGIGRLPVQTLTEALSVVSKIMNYAEDPQGMGNWRNRVLLVADHLDRDGTTHVSQSDSYSDDIYLANPCINIDKVYLDNYQMVITASGSRFPDGKQEVIDRINSGELIVNYTGHGGEVAWSNASILEISDITQLHNGSRLPAFITATCEFGRWDDPARRSGAELLIMNEGGGAIAMFTTVRVVYSSPNYALNTNFYDYALSPMPGTNLMPWLGDIFRLTKNVSWGGGINNRNFTLLGDPALKLNYPELEARIKTINGVAPVAGVIDTLPVLTMVNISGEVYDPKGNFLNTYNGDMDVIVYDKPSKFVTRRYPFPFYWQKNKLFIGAVSIVNGEFNIQFVVPVDVSYDDGKSKINLYFQNGIEDGCGCNDDLFIGGSDSSAISDDEGPVVNLFMNDLNFVDGGMVNPDPLMIANLFDDFGINTVGTGIGHELTAVLDGDEENVIVLNEYYSGKKDNFKEGTIKYPFEQLADGEHLLKVKVWDVANNSSTGEVSFVVTSDPTIALGHVLNYPNPFSTHTQFIVEHNHNGALIDITVKIFSVGGHLVKTLEDSFFAEGNLYKEMEWDGLDEYGDVLARGVYVYQVSIRDHDSGENATRFEKLVLLR